jgi:hypothetical protein
VKEDCSSDQHDCSSHKADIGFLNCLFISSDKTFLHDIKHQAEQGHQTPEIAADERPFLCLSA